MSILRLPLVTLVLLAALGCAVAAEPVAHQYSPQTGTVEVGQKLATITVPEGMIFLPPADARYVLETLWHNPPDPDVLGMLVQAAAEKGGTDRHIVVSYDGSGHVDDGDARSLDYDELLEQMQEGAREASAERVRQGYPSIELLGWAEPPHYDRATKKLFWAKSLRFGGEPTPELNYCIRILGRTGVLELNALGTTADLANVAPVAKLAMEATEFMPGQRYADFVPGQDLAKAGGVAALIAGGLVAKKLGLLAAIGLGLLKLGKVLIIPLLLIGGWLGKVFMRRREERADLARQEAERVQRERLAARGQPPPA